MIKNFYITDIAVVIILLYFFFRGWFQGLIKVLLGPSSLIIGLVAGWFYYQHSSNLAASLFITLLVPILPYWFLSYSLKVWQDDNEPDNDRTFFILERIWAAGINLTWSAIVLALTLILLVVAPGEGNWQSAAKNNIQKSKTYILLKSYVGQWIPEDSSKEEKDKSAEK